MASQGIKEAFPVCCQNSCIGVWGELLQNEPRTLRWKGSFITCSTIENGKGKGSPRQQPIGRCIYCGYTSPDPRELTREHILPKGLGGTDTLLKATCANCVSVTSEIERVFIRDTLWVQRSLAGHKSGMRLPDTNKVAILPVLLPPSLLQGPGAPRNETFQLKVLTARIQGTLPKPVEIKESKFIVDPTNFSRVLAKTRLLYSAVWV